MNGLKERFFGLAGAGTTKKSKGFTIPEVIIAGTILIIICVGTLTVFTTAVNYNRGNNLRMQALSILQLEVEYYRSLKWTPSVTAGDLGGKARQSMGTRTSSDGQQFTIYVTIDDNPAAAGRQTDATTKYKEIKIEAVPVINQTGWLANLKTDVVIQRVRAN